MYRLKNCHCLPAFSSTKCSVGSFSLGFYSVPKKRIKFVTAVRTKQFCSSNASRHQSRSLPSATDSCLHRMPPRLVTINHEYDYLFFLTSTHFVNVPIFIIITSFSLFLFIPSSLCLSSLYTCFFSFYLFIPFLFVIL